MSKLESGPAIAAMLFLGACMSSTPNTAPDPRVGLRAGKTNAAEAISNLKSLSSAPSPSGGHDSTMNADLAFTGNFAVQGNFKGPVIWDMTDAARPQMVVAINCPASQN